MHTRTHTNTHTDHEDAVIAQDLSDTYFHLGEAHNALEQVYTHTHTHTRTPVSTWARRTMH